MKTGATLNVSDPPMSDQIYQRLKWSLTIGEFSPGSLVSIRKLAARMGTSAMPVREALSRLASERLLLSAANRSYRVAELDAKRVSEQFFVRSRLEREATILATPRMTSRQVEQIVTLATQMANDIEVGDNENYIVRNCSFHFSIYAAAGNDELFWTIERLWALTGPFLAQMVRETEMGQDWRGLHIEIAEAIRARNAAHAAELIETDISWSTNTIKELSNESKGTEDT